MGVLIVAPAPLKQGEYDKIRFYVSTDGGNTYTLLNEQNIDVLEYYHKQGIPSYVYKIRYYDSVNNIESQDVNPIAIDNTEVYTTTDLVARFIRVSRDKLIERIPDIVYRIRRVEDYIDNRLQTTWKSKKVENEYHTPIRTFSYDGYVIYTKYFPVLSIDKLEVWNGNSWTDFITTKQEGRGKSYWVVLEKGKVYISGWFMGYWWFHDQYQVRVSYTYGRGADYTNRWEKIPKDLEDIATKLVVIDIYETEGYTWVVPEGAEGSMSWSERIDRWKQQIEEWFSRNERHIVGGTWRAI